MDLNCNRPNNILAVIIYGAEMTPSVLYVVGSYCCV